MAWHQRMYATRMAFCAGVKISNGCRGKVSEYEAARNRVISCYYVAIEHQ